MNVHSHWTCPGTCCFLLRGILEQDGEPAGRLTPAGSRQRGEWVPGSGVRGPGLVQSLILLIAETLSLVGFNRLPLQFTCLHGDLVRMVQVKLLRASLVVQCGKESACQCRRCEFDPWVGKIPWRRKWQPTPVFLPGESHGQRSLVG